MGSEYLIQRGEVTVNAGCEWKRKNTQLVGRTEDEREGVNIAEDLTEGEVLQRHEGDGHEGLCMKPPGSCDGGSDGLGQVTKEHFAAVAVDEAKDADDRVADGLTTRDGNGTKRRELLAAVERRTAVWLVHDD